MKNLLLPSFATLLLAAPSHAQNFETAVMIRTGPSDIVLNERLLESILDTKDIREHMSKEVGKVISNFDLSAHMPGAHHAGTYQVHIETTLASNAPWTNEDQSKAKKVLLKHMGRRLNDLFYAQPERRLQARRHQLRDHFAELHERLQQLHGDQKAVSKQLTRRTQELANLEAQMLDAKMQVSTERAARKQLANLRDQNVAYRDKLRHERMVKEDMLSQMHSELTTLEAQFAQNGNQKKETKERLTSLNTKFRRAQTDLAKWRQMTKDIEAQLTTVLNELPQGELKLQRAEATLQALQDQLAASSERLAEAKARRDKRVPLEINRQYVDIDLQVTREQLIEVERELARLTPVHVEVLGSR